MHLIIFCIEAILLGAPYAFPDLPPLLGQIMFWAGVAGLVIYLAWLAVRNFRSHLWPIAEGLLGPLGRSTRMLIAGALVAIGAIITALGTVMFQQQWAVSTIDNAKDEKPTAQTGTWQGNRFIYDTPQPVLTKALRPEDDGKFFRFQVPNVLPNSFVQFRVEYDGGTAKALVVSHESQEVGWQSITRNTQAGVRIADDSTTVLKVHVPQNSDMTVVRLYTLWWERPTGKQSKPIVDSPAARRLSEIQQRSVAEALKEAVGNPTQCGFAISALVRNVASMLPI